MACSLLVFSCHDNENDIDLPDDRPTQEISGRDARITPQSFNNIQLKDLPASFEIDESVTAGEVRITSDSDMDGEIDYYVENGELHLEGREADGVVIYTNPDNVRKLEVRGNNDVYLAGTPVLDYLEIVTKGNSVLTMDEMRVKNLVTRREGGSKMYLSSEVDDPEADTLFWDEGDVMIVNDNFVIYTDNDIDYLLYSPVVEVRDGQVFVYNNSGDDRKRYFLTQKHELRNQGSSYADAFDLPALRVISRNLGNSESNVWAVDYLEVEGVGNSVLNYMGNPVTELDLKGQATVNKVN